MLTFGEAKQIISQWAARGGLCPTNERVKLFVIEVLQYMLMTGAYGSVRKFTFQAVKGVFTVPYELEVPEKVKIDNFVGSVWDRWFEFHSTREMGCSCIPAGEALFEDPNYYPTVYDIPHNGAKVGIQGTCQESPDAHVIIQGEDPTGRVIFTQHKGNQISGEYLTIRKGTVSYSTVTFGKVTGVLKSGAPYGDALAPTNGYAQLYWVCPTTGSRGFLADYSPLETKPSYRRYRLTSSICQPLMKVEVLGKIRLKPDYADTDFIPFDNILTLRTAAQSVHSQYNDDVQTATAKDQTMVEFINRENTSKRVQNGQPVEYLQATSPGQIRNIVGWP